MTIILVGAVLTFSNCKFSEADIYIERFEFMDIYAHGDREVDKLNDRLVYEAYLIHGYNRKYDKEINEIVDNFICDSIFPHLDFSDKKCIIFYKKSKNTNRENFQVRPKQKHIYARSNDKLFYYRFLKDRNDSLIAKTKYFFGLKEPDPPSQKFSCD